MNGKQIIALVGAIVVTLAGLLAGVVLAFFETYDMSSRPPTPGSHKFDFLFWLLFPALGGLPGLVWVALIFRGKNLPF
jgi:hypothetical protein